MITILAPYFFPAVKAGGPIKTLMGVCSILDIDNYKYKVVTRDKDIDGRFLNKNDFINNVEYTSRISVNYLLPFFNKSKLIWINSLYSYQFSIIPLIALFFTKKTSILISPRGQLLAGSISIKKKTFLFFLRIFLKFSKHKVIIHYTNLEEKINSLKTFSSFNNVVFNNPVLGEIKEASLSRNDNKKTILGIFGRISPIKNIDFIIKLIPLLQNDISLQIHGSLENQQYKSKLDHLIESLNISHKISFCGSYNKDTFVEKARNVDIILIPSFSENFCHVFFEAIEMRKIVIGSTGLPWKEVNTKVKNTILPLNENRWVERIQTICEMSNRDYRKEQDKLIEYYYHIHDSVEKDILDNFNKLTQNTNV